ncbi:unnamed protein product [Rotaria sordida]|uniref:Uncharacterized protein n=1 Tax=Rotaria sordida TaxID=392033 RepID=A0A820CG05_9BILA|nr:unnamed protein product [Rotaria sordida]CAF4213101.1 unnamed protein product [Rotaria sordida]
MNENLFTTEVSNTPMDANSLISIIIDGNHPIMKNFDEVVVNDSNAHSSNEEQTFYSKLNAYKARQPKCGKENGVDAKFHVWWKKAF